MTRRPVDTRPTTPSAPTDRGRTPTPPRVHGTTSSALAQRRHGPRTRADVEARYISARDAWTAAMRAANSGRPADLAALAIVQGAYEAAVAERERWESGGHVAIPIEPEAPERDLGAIIGQELAWRKVKATEEKPAGILGRIRRRMSGN